MFPVGWDNNQVERYCYEHDDKAEKFKTGHCSIGLSYFLAMGATAASFFCSLFSFVADKAVFSPKVQDEILEGKQLICLPWYHKGKLDMQWWANFAMIVVITSDGNKKSPGKDLSVMVEKLGSSIGILSESLIMEMIFKISKNILLEWKNIHFCVTKEFLLKLNMKISY